MIGTELMVGADALVDTLDVQPDIV